LNGSIKPSTSTKISLRNFFSQTGTNLSQFSLNQYRSRQDSVTTEYIDKKSIVSFYEQNSLISNQLTFEKFFGTEGAKLEVLIGTNALFRNTPDYSRLFYDRSGNLIDGQQNEDKFQGTFGNLPPVSFNQEFSGKFFSRLDERSYSPTVNLTLPFTVLKLKNTGRAGILYQERAREFTGRNYLYLKGSNAGSVLFQGPDSIFRDANFQPDLLTLYETTQVSDFYSAGTRLWAGYLMNETQFGSRGSKVIYGVRYESYYQEIEATEFGKKVRTTQASTVGDWFPSINLNLNPTSWFAVRMAWSKTVNRPELRELAGFTFFEPNQNVYFYGNPNLVRSKITNADLKLEFYPNDFSFISLNGFYKKFINPIEVTRGFVTTLPTFTYANRDEATSYGWELEGKYRFAPLDSLWGTRFFGGLQFFGNFSLIRSEVLYAQTNFKRPIHGQSPYVCNAGLGYSYEPWALDILMTYNRIGPRVAFLDDQNYAALIWERPRDLVDLSIGKGFGKWMFRLVAGDIFQQDLIQYIVLDRGGREADQKGLFGWISNVPRYQKGQDIPYFRFTQGRTLRFSVQWKL
jgi:outer membrane receptor protein involved in Fe transport